MEVRCSPRPSGSVRLSSPCNGHTEPFSGHATTTGGVLSGAAYVALFGVGTISMMLAISLSRKLVPMGLRLQLLRAVPVSVALLAALLILRRLSLGIASLSPDLADGTCCHWDPHSGRLENASNRLMARVPTCRSAPA